MWHYLKMENRVTIYRLGQEISTRIEILKNRANEGRGLQEAKDFCSFLLWSGLLGILEENTASFDGNNLPMDGKEIKQRVMDLQELVHQQFKQGSKLVPLELSQLEAINHKLDLLAGRLAQIPIAEQEAVELRIA